MHMYSLAFVVFGEGGPGSHCSANRGLPLCPNRSLGDQILSLFARFRSSLYVSGERWRADAIAICVVFALFVYL